MADNVKLSSFKRQFPLRFLYLLSSNCYLRKVRTCVMLFRRHPHADTRTSPRKLRLKFRRTWTDRETFHLFFNPLPPMNGSTLVTHRSSEKHDEEDKKI